MTVLTTDSEVSYLGNGAATEFAFTFLIPDDDSIRVYFQADANSAYEEVTNDCVVTGYGNPLGGAVTYLRDAAPIPNDSILSIIRRVPNTQEITVSNQTRYDASVAMSVWDRLTMQIQDLVETQKRSPRFPFGAILDGVMIEDLADGETLMWEAAGQRIVAGPTAGDIAVAQGYAEDAETAADRAEAAAAAAAAAAQILFIDTLDDLLADTDFTYTAAQPKTVVAGNTIRTIREGFAFEVLASGAGSQHHTTAGGVKLNVRIQAGRVDLKAFGPDASGASDTRAEFQAAVDLAATSGGGATVVIPAGTYRIDSTVNLASDVCLLGERDAIIEQGANGITMFRGVSLFRVKLENLTIRNGAGHTTGTPISLESCERCIVAHNDLNGMPSSNNGSIRLLSTKRSWVMYNWIINSVGNAICDIGSGGGENLHLGNLVNGCGGFGIFVSGTSSKNRLIGNYTAANDLELIGIAVGSNYNTITGNHAESCGDNGISVTGNYNVVSGNNCRNNDLSGIHLYGSFNTCTGNSCERNGQASASRAGIAVQPAFGGSGQNNLITGNMCDDPQSSPTQNNSVRILASSYTNWAAGQSISIGDYRVNGIRIYQATTAGTTGATAPTHTSGTASDGGVTWNYINFFRTSSETRGNIVMANKFGISVSDALLDQQDAELEPLASVETGVVFKGRTIQQRRVTEASITANATDHLIGVRSSSPWTITLPATTNLQVGREIIVQDETGQAGTNTITINGNGNNINGSATRTITSSYGRVDLYWTGTQWIAS